MVLVRFLPSPGQASRTIYPPGATAEPSERETVVDRTGEPSERQTAVDP